MPNIYQRVFVNSDDDVNAVPIFRAVFPLLQDLYELEHLSVTMHELGHHDVQVFAMGGSQPGEEHWSYYANPLILDTSGFHNLVSLQLLDLSYGDHDLRILAAELSSTLLASPQLRHLTLSLDDSQRGGALIHLLADEYQKKGGVPLSLETLQLGHGRPRAHRNTPHPAASDVLKLCRPAVLERVLLFNGFGPRPLFGNGFSPLMTTMPPNMILSIRHFSGLALDDAMLSLIHIIGNDTSLPPTFMSELVFVECNCSPNQADKLDIDQTKGTYWPRSLAIERMADHLLEKQKMSIIWKTAQYTGLKHLHFPLEWIGRKNQWVEYKQVNIDITLYT